MKRKAIDREVVRISPYYQWWKKHLGLEDWNISVHYFDKPFTKSPKGQRKRSAIVADIEVHWEYKQATMRVNLRETRHRTDAQIETIIVHELTHAKVNEMRHYGADDGSYHEERVVTELAAAYIWVRYAKDDSA